MFAKNRYAEAVVGLGRCAERWPHNADAHFNLGVALQTLASDPTSPQPGGPDSAGPMEEAVAAYQQAVRLKPSHRSALTNAAQLLKDAGRAAEAVAMFEQLTAVPGPLWTGAVLAFRPFKLQKCRVHAVLRSVWFSTS